MRMDDQQLKLPIAHMPQTFPHTLRSCATPYLVSLVSIGWIPVVAYLGQPAAGLAVLIAMAAILGLLFAIFVRVRVVLYADRLDFTPGFGTVLSIRYDEIAQAALAFQPNSKSFQSLRLRPRDEARDDIYVPHYLLSPADRRLLFAVLLAKGVSAEITDSERERGVESIAGE
jgi:hypothetical protein